jgi:asparagine synthase (glutamine-hydrolysing)
MCGINGILSSKITNIAEAVGQMNRRLAHRGPNDEGVWHSNNIALGHKRLSIIDLSAAGHQPMTSVCGRYVLVFNGEIYNYRELKSKIDYPYITNTDTEVLLATWTKYGCKTPEMLHGMFAFAVYDIRDKTLTLVRDRMGIKPLYYCDMAAGFAFSSEVRALLASGIAKVEISPVALADYLRYQTVQTPDTILKDVKMVEAGMMLTIDATSSKITQSAFWNINAFKPLTGITVEDARSGVRSLFMKAVEKRLVADVPFGAFLSGGIDSSAVVGAMAQASSNRIKTFNISFAEEEFSEARYARHIAGMHQTEHHEIKLSPQKFLEYLPGALAAVDHPSGDGPNTWIVSKVTKEAGIDMALSGLGGDELFAGYAIFTRMMKLNRYSALWNIPKALRQMAGSALMAVHPSVASAKMAALLAMKHFDFDTMYAISRQALMDNALAGILATSPLPCHLPVEWLHRKNFATDAQHVLSHISMAEMTTYMQNVLLRDSDQMSMAHALELRVPFLDHELVEFVLSLPDAVKYPHTPKQLLVESVPDLLPDYIVKRPKMGFVFPWAHWLKNELHAYADVRIRNLAKREYFNEQAVLNLWNDFVKGNPAITYSRIFPLVALEEWTTKVEN